jgi:hypothetical protein
VGVGGRQPISQEWSTSIVYGTKMYVMTMGDNILANEKHF